HRDGQFRLHEPAVAEMDYLIGLYPPGLVERDIARSVACGSRQEHLVPFAFVSLGYLERFLLEAFGELEKYSHVLILNSFQFRFLCGKRENIFDPDRILLSSPSSWPSRFSLPCLWQTASKFFFCIRRILLLFPISTTGGISVFLPP